MIEIPYSDVIEDIMQKYLRASPPYIQTWHKDNVLITSE